MPFSTKMVATAGSGRASTNGSAESTRTSAATVAGEALASSREIMPPIELPIRMTGWRAVTGTDSMKRCRRARFPLTVVSRPPARVRPNPARSGATNRYWPVSSGAMADQFTAEPPSPCTPTMTGPRAGPPKSR